MKCGLTLLKTGMEAVRMRTYTGIKIRASFRGGEKLLSLEQLSGGQKVLFLTSRRPI